MNAAKFACNPKMIEQFLTDELDAQELESFESHLEVCSSCREQLERLAAEPSWWSESKQHLRWREETTASFYCKEGASFHSDWSDTEPSVFGLTHYLNPSEDPLSLGRIETYEIRGVIGRGGFGIVLKAFEPALNRIVAIKVLTPEYASNGTAKQRFIREARAAAAVVHDHVISIHRVSEAPGLPYLVMPYIRGASLEQRIQRQGPLPIEVVLRIAQQIASGLAAAHAQGIVHRDIKPANILMEEGVERVRITDFGLARAADDASMTRSGVIAGTPQYMSPEQAEGDDVDQRSDLFSLGSVIYAMATGRPPFRAESTLAVLRKIRETEPRSIREINPQVPVWLEWIVQKLHAKNRDERFETAEEVAALLEGCLAHYQQPNVPLPERVQHLVSKRKARCFSQTNRRRLIVAGAMMFLVALLAVLWMPAKPRDDGTTEKGQVGDVEPKQESSDWAITGQHGVHPEPNQEFPIRYIWKDDIDLELERIRQQLDQLDLDKDPE